MNFFDLANPLGWQVKTLIVVTALTMFGGVCYVKGREAGMEKHYEYKSKVEAAQQRVAAENQRQLDEAKRATEGVAVGWDAAVRDLDRQYSQRLLRAKRDSAAEGAAACSAQGPDGTTKESAARAEASAASCINTEYNAVRDATQLLWLQRWVREVCK